jgi:hypothetical protein
MEKYSKHGRNKCKNRFDEYLLAFFQGRYFYFRRRRGKYGFLTDLYTPENTIFELDLRTGDTGNLDIEQWTGRTGQLNTLCNRH